MSVSVMTERALSAAAPGAQPAVAAAPSAVNAIAAVAAYFPTETMGAYLAVLALIQPDTAGARWLFFSVFLVFTTVVVLYYAANKHHTVTGARIDRRSLAWLLVFALGSFAIWSATTPWSPFRDISSDAPRYAGAITIIVSPLLPMAAQVLHITPPWR
ncbi:MAG: hypothetical protein HYX53_15700 [Chloroflexi bacterium]|nr:hypothetical protein [Chloroflexota bacterium]